MKKKFFVKRYIISYFLTVLFCLAFVSFPAKASERSVVVGETIQLSDTNWENATGYEKTWEVTNPMVASISYSGTTCTVRGLRSGTTTVLCYTRAWKTTPNSVLVNGKWQQQLHTTVLPTTKSSHTIHVKENCTITFMANGGTVTESSRMVPEGDVIGTLPDAMRAGYHFAGWYEGSTQITADTVCTGNTIYLARWEPVTVGTGSVKNFTKGYKKFIVEVDSISGASGYEVKYSLKANMKNAKTITSRGTICGPTGLKAGKKYYVSVRAYTYDSTGAIIYGEWGSVKSIKLPKVMLDKSQTILLKGQTEQLKLQGAKKGVVWSSKKTSIATVSKNGKVKAKKAGTTTVTAKYKNKKYTCKIKVENPELTHKNIKLLVGQEKKISLKKTSLPIKWSIKDFKIVNISKGLIKAKSAGNTVVKATVNGKSFSCKVKVENPVLSDTSIQLLKGQTKQIKLSGTTFAVTYRSSDSKIVSVNEKGMLTAKGAGTAKITAKANGKEFVCTVKVEAPSLSKTNVILSKGEGMRMKLENTTRKPVWSSSDASVVAVEESEYITLKGIKKGTAVITATIDGISYQCNVIVEEPSLKMTSVYLNVGEKVQLAFEGTQRTPLWTNAFYSDGIEVSDTGEVTALKPGISIVVGKLGNMNYKCYIGVIGELGTQTNPRKASEPFNGTVYYGAEKLGTFTITMTKYQDSSTAGDDSICVGFEIYTKEKAASRTISQYTVLNLGPSHTLIEKDLEECMIYRYRDAIKEEVLREGKSTLTDMAWVMQRAVYEPVIYPIQTGYDAKTGEKIYTYFITE